MIRFPPISIPATQPDHRNVGFWPRHSTHPHRLAGKHVVGRPDAPEDAIFSRVPNTYTRCGHWQQYNMHYPPTSHAHWLPSSSTHYFRSEPPHNPPSLSFPSVALHIHAGLAYDSTVICAPVGSSCINQGHYHWALHQTNQNPPPPNMQAVAGAAPATTGTFAHGSGLWEGLPSQTNRYDDVFAGLRSYQTVPPGSPSSPAKTHGYTRAPVLPVPIGWEQYIHPVEGRPYFYQPTLRIVTEIYIRHPGQLGHIMEWYNVFVALRNHVLPGASAFDVYLDCNGRDTCRYYMIDHANKTVCWLRQRTTSEINISDVRSTMGLRALLNEEYWTHAEYMPKNENHLAATRAELQGSLAASLLDHMTSEGSTSPFTKAECESYLFALNKAAESGYMIHLNWSIARVMGLLVHSRNVNLYGQYGARLDRTATVEDKRHPARSSSYLYRNALLGGGPIIHLTRLENLWVDRIIYTHHWRALLHELYQEWTMAAGGAGVMWASNMVFVASPGVDLLTKFVCAGSGILAGASGVYALSMLRDHRALGKYAAHATSYFQQHEHHAAGLQELTIKYSLPWAGVIWSFGITCGAVVLFFVSSILLFLESHTHVLVTIVLIAGVCLHSRRMAPRLRDAYNSLDHTTSEGSTNPLTKAMRESYLLAFTKAAEFELSPRSTENVSSTSPFTCAGRESHFSMRREVTQPGYNTGPAGYPSYCSDPATLKEITTIKSGMQVDEVMRCLVNHGCQDITSELDPSGISSDPIASGGFGNIYLGKLRDGTEVAIKSLFNLRNLDASNKTFKTLKRAAREIYAWSKCDHSGILPLLGMALFRGQVAVVTQWMENGTLSSFLRKQPSFDRIQLCVQLAEAFEYMHARRIVHGDIKAVNVLMSNNNVPLFADFGNALLTHGATLQFTATTSLGITPCYTAPEILKGDSRYSIEADIYAFGMLIFEIVTGRAPFADKLAAAIIYTVTVKKMVPNRPDLSFLLRTKTLEDRFWRLLTRCWAHDPNHRPSAPELREELESIWQRLDDTSVN